MAAVTPESQFLAAGRILDGRGLFTGGRKGREVVALLGVDLQEWMLVVDSVSACVDVNVSAAAARIEAAGASPERPASTCSWPGSRTAWSTGG